MYTCIFSGFCYPLLLGQRSQFCEIAVLESGFCHSFVFRLSPVSGAFNRMYLFLLRIEGPCSKIFCVKCLHSELRSKEGT